MTVIFADGFRSRRQTLFRLSGYRKAKGLCPLAQRTPNPYSLSHIWGGSFCPKSPQLCLPAPQTGCQAPGEKWRERERDALGFQLSGIDISMAGKQEVACPSGDSPRQALCLKPALGTEGQGSGILHVKPSHGTGGGLLICWAHLLFVTC